MTHCLVAKSNQSILSHKYIRFLTCFTFYTKSYQHATIHSSKAPSLKVCCTFGTKKLFKFILRILLLFSSHRE